MKLTYNGKRYCMFFIALVMAVSMSILLGKWQPVKELEQELRKPFYHVLFETGKKFDVVVVKIDEKTFSALKNNPGLKKFKDSIWPLPPCIYGELLDRLTEYGATCVGFDIIFESFANVFLPWYADYGPFVKAQQTNDIPVIIGAKRVGSDYILPCRQLRRDGFYVGLINVKRKFGEIVSYRFKHDKYNSLAYSIARSCGRQKGIEIAGWSEQLLKEKHLISFQNSPGKGFPMISLSDVLLGIVPEHVKKSWNIENIIDLFDGKDVLVALTMMEHYDFHSSPADSKDGKKLHGVEFHANAVEMLLNYAKLRYRVLEDKFKILLLVIAALVSWMLLVNLRSFHWLWMSALLLFGYYFGIIKVFQATRVFYPISTAVICYLLYGVFATFLVWSLERKEKDFIKGAFGKYIPETVAKQISDNPDILKLGGRKMNITVLFSDICGFTGIAEKMKSDKLIKFLNNYLDTMTEEVFKTEGTLDKYIGDAIMAFWGAPFECSDHAERACRTALGMKNRLSRFNSENPEFPDLRIGIGLHSGESVVGNAGSRKRFDYTAIGDNVNTSSRLEGLTRYYGVPIIISGSTFESVRDSFDTRLLDRVTVKGKEHITDLYELVSVSGSADQQWLKLHEKAMNAYFSKDWNQAERLFLQIQNDYSDVHSELFLSRIAEIRSSTDGGKSHTGIFELKRK